MALTNPNSNRAMDCTALLAFALIGSCLSNVFAAEPAQETLVGRSVRFEQVVIDGPKLKAKPITQATSLVLRIERVYPHGSVFRYDIEAYALEPGDYDLHDYLEPVEGTETNATQPPQDDQLTLRVGSSLGDEYATPNTLQSGRTPWLGGYRWMLILAGLAWLLGLVGLLRWGYKKRADDKIANVATEATTADRLRPLIDAAVAGNLDADQRAILERLLLTHWRERLDLTDADPAEGLATLREHPEAGELLRNLEDWLHRPDPPKQVNVEGLLRPYLNVSDATNVDASLSPNLTAEGSTG